MNETPRDEVKPPPKPRPAEAVPAGKGTMVISKREWFVARAREPQ